jgi:hypothetical protein
LLRIILEAVASNKLVSTKPHLNENLFWFGSQAFREYGPFPGDVENVKWLFVLFITGAVPMYFRE